MSSKTQANEKNTSQSETPAHLLPPCPVRELSALELFEWKLNLHFRRFMRRQRLFSYKDKKFTKRGHRVRFQEALAMDFVARNTTIRVPCVLDVFTIDGTVHIIQERIVAPVLEDVWHRLSPEEQRSSMIQLKESLDQLRTLKPPHPECVQSVDGSGLNDDRVKMDKLGSGVWGPFDNHDDFHRFLNYEVLRAQSERYPRVQEPLRKVYGKQYKTVFSHGDLGPHNILWKDGSIVIIDWERSGWFPEYWDYTRAHAARGFMTAWWKLFEETVDKYDDELDLAIRISEYFETL